LGRFYLDTSAIVKLYVREPGTDSMLRLASAIPAHQLLVLSIAAVEVRSAVRRRERIGDIDTADAVAVLEQFTEHLASTLVRQSISDRTVDLSLRLVDGHGLKAYDALQLAGALAIAETSTGHPPTFVCSDAALLRAAKAERIPILDPVNADV
jgi:uncharacterized protein